MSWNNVNQPLHEYLRHYSRFTPNKEAIIFYGKTITYQELDDLSDRFAMFLYSRGIKKGDKVALFLPNCPQYIICHFGIQKIGAIVGPCSPMFKEWELAYEVNDLGAKAIVTLEQLHPIVDQVRNHSSIELVITTSYIDFLPEIPQPEFPEKIPPKKRLADCIDLIQIFQSKMANPPRIEIDVENDVSLIVYTSGSTGQPKGAMLTYRNALYKSYCVAQTRNTTAHDISLSIMPICHIAGMLGMNVVIFTGGTLVLLNRFTPESAMDVIERYQVTVAQTVVPMNIAIMKHPDANRVDFRSLRLNACTSFGIPLTEEISNQWKELTGVGLFESAYGLSETHTADTLMSEGAVKFGTTGKPVLETEIKIMSIDEPRREVPIGKEGEIIVKNPGVFKGYLNKPEETAQTLRNGWVYTGDIGKLDQEGYLFFLGRIKEMIKCSGYSVFPEDVEIMMMNHPAISQSAVIGVPDPVRGESVKAFVVIKPEFQTRITEEEIIRWSKEKMAAYKYPRYVEFRESLPVTGTGKLLRRLLADEEKEKANYKEVVHDKN
ncbi:AMP-binding protein [Neobacillus drentensis]|uniref:AMP-binding protein n=1 Tax=Neobacillus drentensis TaxID=220684 RepID=UPI003001D519